MAKAEKFHHPYEPYDIQLQFMRTLYECIDQGKIGIFESPTGTGKSLSLACGSLSWLRDHKRKEFDESLAAVAGDDDDPEWMIQHSREEKKRQVIQKRADLEAKLENIRQQERKIRERQEYGPPHVKKRKLDNGAGNDDGDADEEDEFVLDDYESDGEGFHASSKTSSGPDLGLSKETQALMQKLGYSLHATPKDDELEPDDELKIYFCSRTHSQLTQFVNELRRIKLPPGVPIEEESASNKKKREVSLHEELKHLSLGSRKNLCINSKVSALKSATAINERCLELQDAKSTLDKKCPFVPNKENEASVLDFQNHALARIRDIEDLGTLGKKIGIITLPYPLLLQKSAREALNLSLKNHIIIIDEAHNLMDAISSIHNIEISLSQLQRSRKQLTIYLQKFRNRLKGKNRVYVTQVVRLLDSLSGFLQEKVNQGKKEDEEGTVQPMELLKGKGVDQINLFKLMHYLQESKLARKVEGYVSLEQQRRMQEEQKKLQQNRQQQKPEQRKGNPDGGVMGKEVSVPVLTHVQSLFNVLTNPAREGRFFYTVDKEDESETKIKYLLLDPSEHFRDIVEEARAVVLAGGTMSPMDDYLNQLFPYLSPSKITTLSCGHVIPPSNLFVSAITHSPSSNPFDFTFSSRNTTSTLDSLGQTILRLLPTIPDGCVLFFPSYSYLNLVVSHWQKNGTWSRLQNIKPIYQESQSGSTSTEEILTAYTSTILNSKDSRGALLLAVIGAKLSEGINFSDRLGRCVMVVGLPYPNPHAPEQRAKVQYLEQKCLERGDTEAEAKRKSREGMENVCMRAVNQAVGRAVRHKGDWSTILLVDGRYAQERIVGKLPGWIRGSMKSGGGEKSKGFADVEKGLREFYRGKKELGM